MEQTQVLSNNKLPNQIKWYYAVGQLGWSILSGIIQVWLVWFYYPPANRLTGVVAAIIGAVALMIFTRYKDE